MYSLENAKAAVIHFFREGTLLLSFKNCSSVMDQLCDLFMQLIGQADLSFVVVFLDDVGSFRRAGVATAHTGQPVKRATSLAQKNTLKMSCCPA